MKENEGDAWEPVKQWLLTLRRNRISVVLVHHAGRNGEMRGTSKREDDVFWIIRLDEASKDQRNGAQFLSRFTKDRNFKPEVSDDPDELLDGPKPHPVTRWLDLATQTLVDPKADPDADRRSNLQEYRDGTDPTVPERSAAPQPGL